MYRFLKLNLLVFLLFCCQERKEVIEKPIKIDYTKSPTYIFNQDTLNYYLDKALNQGDEKALGLLSSHYFLSEKGNEFYIYALIFANKYKKGSSYNYLYTCLEINKRYLDKKTRKLAEYYLLKAYELDSVTYGFKIKSRYINKGKKIPKSIDLVSEILP
jgi:hypothetical protein